jgi:hypothetical protein
MILLSEEKSSNALLPGSSLVTEQHAPSHTEDTVSSSGSIQQQACHAQSSAPPQGDYDPEELPPPTYESIKNAGNSIRRIVILSPEELMPSFQMNMSRTSMLSRKPQLRGMTTLFHLMMLAHLQIPRPRKSLLMGHLHTRDLLLSPR